jgi:alkylated DNA repair dioxygenase AlkB
MINWPVTYIPNFIPNTLSVMIFDDLWNNLPWLRVTRRREYWTNIFDRSYTYGGPEYGRTYEAQPPVALVDEINAQMVEKEYIPIPFEGCFLNGYETKRDALGWHADDDPGIDHSRPIAVVTLYDVADAQPRELGVMNKETGEKTRFPLANGSLLLMHPGMQDTHLHCIHKAGFEARPRISLTYRGLVV